MDSLWQSTGGLRENIGGDSGPYKVLTDYNGERFVRTQSRKAGYDPRGSPPPRCSMRMERLGEVGPEVCLWPILRGLEPALSLEDPEFRGLGCPPEALHPNPE